jgi:hypothetical protein
MGNAENKKEFIRELFRYYQPTLSKEKQITLLEDWIKSCVQSEEYEMASVLEGELREVLENPEKPVDSTLKVVRIEDIHANAKKMRQNPVKTPEKPVKKDEKSKKKWKFYDKWGERYGFTLINIDLSIIKRTFKLEVINYGVSYGL